MIVLLLVPVLKARYEEFETLELAKYAPIFSTAPSRSPLEGSNKNKFASILKITTFELLDRPMISVMINRFVQP